jgi:isoquinoline 1-oxidoreductase beta subunit
LTTVTRRQLLAAGALATGGLAIGLAIPALRQYRAQLTHVPLLGDPGWIAIAADNSITLYSTLTEMGQGVWSCLAQFVAEELEVDLPRIEVRMAPAWRAFVEPIGFHTGGSSSAQRLFAHVPGIAAAARIMLVETAAARWQVPPSECLASNGRVVHGNSSRGFSFGELASDAAKRTPPLDPPLKTAKEWRVIGRPVRRPDAPAKLNGSAVYGMDLQLPGMLVAAVSQSPFSGSTLSSMNRAAAVRSPGVRRIIELDDTIAVVADNYWQASRGLEQAQVEWNAPASLRTTAELRDELRKLVHGTAAACDSNDAACAGEQLVEATYEAPFLMHAQMEPLNATAKVDRFSAEVWAPTQAQSAMQADVANALELWAHAVTVHTPMVGGGFGRRLHTDYGVTAARIAREFDVPVKAVWSREEDCVQGRFRPMSVARLSAFLRSGSLDRFAASVASIGEQPRTGGLQTIPYRTRASSAAYSGLTAPIRIGPWRAVDSSQNVFFRECFIDECAHAAAVDPLQFRRTLLAHDPRALRVLDEIAALAAWQPGKETSQPRFLGMAFNEGFGSLTAQVAELVRTDDGALRVAHVYCVVDCGVALDPNNIRAQLEGGMWFGLSAAMWEEATHGDEGLEQRNFHRYRVLRMDETPQSTIKILEAANAPIGGIGEVGVPAIAPAVANAVFAATGTRVRSLPLNRAGVKLHRQ